MNLHLSLQRHWFEMTKAGIKTEDYREINKYWIQRLITIKFNRTDWKHEKDIISLILQNKEYYSAKRIPIFQFNIMTLGYPKPTDTSRIIQLEHKGIEIREGNPDWGAEPGKIYFVIKHGKLINC